MKISTVTPVVLAVAAMSFAACNDATSTRNILATDAIVTADVASSAGDAIAQSVSDMMANESTGGLAGISASSAVSAEMAPVTYSRARTCFDATGAVVANCSPIASVRKIVTRVTIDGGRSGSSTTEGGVTKTWSGAVHRVVDDTVQRVFNTAQPPAETQRVHGAVATARDTTTFTEGAFSRLVAESANDTVKLLTWNLPRTSNPWPVSGSIVRAVAVHLVATRENRTETRDVTRRVEVTFPADAQGNVVLKVNDKTCNLNLVTHAVTNCR